MGTGADASRLRCHADAMGSSRTMGLPQHGQGRAGAAGFSAGAGDGAQPVAEAMCSRFALAAG